MSLAAVVLQLHCCSQVTLNAESLKSAAEHLQQTTDSVCSTAMSKETLVSSLHLGNHLVCVAEVAGDVVGQAANQAKLHIPWPIISSMTTAACPANDITSTHC